MSGARCRSNISVNHVSVDSYALLENLNYVVDGLDQLLDDMIVRLRRLNDVIHVSETDGHR